MIASRTIASGGCALDLDQRRAAVGREGGLVALGAERPRERPPHRPVVVHDQHPGLHHRSVRLQGTACAPLAYHRGVREGLPFPVEEYRGRAERVRARMRSAGSTSCS